MNSLLTQNETQDGPREISPVSWKFKAHTRMRWIKVVDKGDKQGENGEVIWWPGLLYKDHTEMMSDIHPGEHSFIIRLLHFPCR